MCYNKIISMYVDDKKYCYCNYRKPEVVGSFPFMYNLVMTFFKHHNITMGH